MNVFNVKYMNNKTGDYYSCMIIASNRQECANFIQSAISFPISINYCEDLGKVDAISNEVIQELMFKYGPKEKPKEKLKKPKTKKVDENVRKETF